MVRPRLPDKFRIARDPPETGGECSDRLLHCEDGAEPGRALDNALISLRSFGQRVGLDYRFNFSLGYVIQGFVKVFRAICWLPMILMRLKSSSISEIESGSASAPITMNLPSGRRP